MRVLKPTGNIMAFCSYNLMGKWHEVFDPLFDTFQFFVWHKSNPIPKFRKAGFLNSCELIVCMWNKGHTWNFGKQNEMHNFFESPICMSPERLKTPNHPTQKPIKLLSHLLKIATNLGDTVLDPFMEVGSTGVAAINNGRKFICIELDTTYFEAAKKRLRENTARLVLRFNSVDKKELILQKLQLKSVLRRHPLAICISVPCARRCSIIFSRGITAASLSCASRTPIWSARVRNTPRTFCPVWTGLVWPVTSRRFTRIPAANCIWNMSKNY